MQAPGLRTTARIRLAAPVIFLILAATAFPVELRSPTEGHFDFRLSAENGWDIVANVVGYIPFGILFGVLGVGRAAGLAGALSVSSEIVQLVMMHRDPGLVDIISNVGGATLGALASTHWKLRLPSPRAGRGTTLLAAMSIIAIVWYVRTVSGEPVNRRGSAEPGILEAHWKLDESGGREVLDSSGNRLTGKFRKEAGHTEGALGQAAVFDGTNSISLGRSTAFRLAGSMTISAWINSSAYPVDDAAIVSQIHDKRGYQLDTTVDRGPRTIGFKLIDACGKLMARYGRTPLTLNTWYHVAGVYDAASRTLDVYLNGELDNGFLLGTVGSAQTSSRGAVYVGKRGDYDDFNFSGLIDDVRIYSTALTKSQVAADMRGETAVALSNIHSPAPASCSLPSDPADKTIPFVAALLGTFVSIVIIGLRPSVPWPIIAGFSFTAGALLLTVTAADLPALNTWTLPLIAMAGGLCVAPSSSTVDDIPH